MIKRNGVCSCTHGSKKTEVRHGARERKRGGGLSCVCEWKRIGESKRTLETEEEGTRDRKSVCARERERERQTERERERERGGQRESAGDKEWETERERERERERARAHMR